MKSSFLELTEFRHVLEKTQVFFSEQDEANGMDSVTRALMAEEASHAASAIRGRLQFVAGVMQRERVPGFERMLWRVSRGNVFLRRVELEKPLEDPTTVIFYTSDLFNQRYDTKIIIFVPKSLVARV